MKVHQYLQQKIKSRLMTQSKNQSVKVGIRVRPLNERQKKQKSNICVQSNENILCIKHEAEAKQFVFDYVFGIQSRQQSIYQSCAFSLVQNALQGFNGTIFAYGQTGAGKTFTMVGDYKDPEIKGIIPRSFQHIITAIQTSQEKLYVVRASFIEIYNEDIMDLLEQKGKVGKKDLKQYPQKGTFVKDLKMVPVKSVDQLFKILDFGNKNRTVFATAMNAVSSRSHALFTIHIESAEGKDKIKTSKLNLVDLAGSERASKTQATGDRLKQGAKINLSLSALGNVINALVDGKRGGHIPYRDSKLTRLLQDSLGGNTKTLMIASVSPASFNYDETLSTLRYAARARNIKNTPKINQDPKDTMIRQYLAQIQKLKKQLGSDGNYVQTSNQIGNQALKKLQQQAQYKQKALNEKQRQLLEMKQKLKEMEGLVLKKSDQNSQISKTRKLKKKKIMKQQELNGKKIQELQKQQNQLMDEKQTKEQQNDIAYWKNISKKLRAKIKTLKIDHQDREKEFQTEKEDLNNTIRSLQGDLSFYTQLITKFLDQEQITVIKDASTYYEQKRAYQIPAFLMHNQQITLPKTLKKHQVQDLWKQKRKGYKLQFLNEQFPELNQGMNKNQFLSPQKKQKSSNLGNPFIQNRRIFNLSNYTNESYKDKQYDITQADNRVFRRTNYKITENSQSKQKRPESRSSSKKLQPLNHERSKSKQINLRPGSSNSKQKIRLLPLKR